MTTHSDRAQQLPRIRPERVRLELDGTGGYRSVGRLAPATEAAGFTVRLADDFTGRHRLSFTIDTGNGWRLEDGTGAELASGQLSSAPLEQGADR